MGLFLFINSKSFLFRYEARDQSAQMANHFPVFTLLLASAYVSRTGMGWWLPQKEVQSRKLGKRSV